MLSMLIRYPIWALRNFLRRLRKPPEYVTFMLQGEYSEYPQHPGNQIMRRIRPPKISLMELGEQFRLVAGDPRVKGIVLHLRPLEMAPAMIESLRGLIMELRKSGKRVVAWATVYAPSNYLVACAADEILLQPTGEINPLGMSQTYPYLAKALKKVGMEGDILPITPYKSAGDMFSRKSMSKEVRKMANWLIDSAFEERLLAIGEGRGIDTDAARELVDRTPLPDDKALDLNLVDALLGEEDLPNHLGTDSTPVRLGTWEAARKALLIPRPVKVSKYVAVIPLEGTIMDGIIGRPPVKPPIDLPILTEPRAGDLTVVQAARQALLDSRAAGVVLYVNSRGGSATSSEAMRAALSKINEAKPLVVSMGPVAASGGYWVSTPGRHIFAQPSTVTGSIGVILGKIVTHGLLDRLFIGREKIQRGEHTDIFDPESRFTKAERAMLWDSITRIYDLFLDRVVDSRGMTRERVDELGGGKVWTGRQAFENGLIDEIGGLEAAIAKACEMAGLSSKAPVRIVTVGKGQLVPVALPAAMLEYAMEGARLLQGTRPMCISPLTLDRT
ncbi:MAG: signal peptide peptidase SppA [Anaerolineales bacterium]